LLLSAGSVSGHALQLGSLAKTMLLLSPVSNASFTAIDVPADVAAQQ